eukprot:2560620-Pleurochrysis_carterae.AAC.2
MRVLKRDSPARAKLVTQFYSILILRSAKYVLEYPIDVSILQLVGPPKRSAECSHTHFYGQTTSYTTSHGQVQTLI